MRQLTPSKGTNRARKARRCPTCNRHLRLKAKRCAFCTFTISAEVEDQARVTQRAAAKAASRKAKYEKKLVRIKCLTEDAEARATAEADKANPEETEAASAP